MSREINEPTKGEVQYNSSSANYNSLSDGYTLRNELKVKSEDTDALDHSGNFAFDKPIANHALLRAIGESGQELKLKKLVAYFTMSILFVELVFFAFIICAHGAKLLTFTDNILQVYIVSIIGQIISTFYVMVKFLFDPNRPSTMQIVQNMVTKCDTSNNNEPNTPEVPSVPSVPTQNY